VKLMGIFDIFKKKSKVESEDPDTYLQKELKSRLEAEGHRVVLEDGSVFVDSKIEILTTIIDNPELHRHLLHMHVVITAGDYFPSGLTEDLVGIGQNMHEKVDSALNNFLSVTLPPILGAFTDSHQPELDFATMAGDKEILWHPKLGNFGFQGKWDESEYPEVEYLLNIIEENLKPMLADQKFNWLKIYLAKQPDGKISGDCSLNNKFWEEGYKVLLKYAKSWPQDESFRAIKQFILFRQCDVSDDSLEN